MKRFGTIAMAAVCLILLGTNDAQAKNRGHWRPSVTTPHKTVHRPAVTTPHAVAGHHRPSYRPTHRPNHRPITQPVHRHPYAHRPSVTMPHSTVYRPSVTMPHATANHRPWSRPVYGVPSHGHKPLGYGRVYTPWSGNWRSR